MNVSFSCLCKHFFVCAEFHFLSMMWKNQIKQCWMSSVSDNDSEDSITES